MKFGILSNIVAIRDTTPHIKLADGYMTADSRWSYYWQDAIRRMAGRAYAMKAVGAGGVVVPDGNPILRYHFHTDVNGLEYVFAMTKAHVYRWLSGSSAWLLMFTCSSDCEYWSSVSFNGKVVATNWVDLVQIWNDATPGTEFADMGSASGIDIGSAVYLTKAKFVVVYENYLHLLYTEEGGVTCPNRDRWSSRGDEEDFDDDGSGDTGFRDFLAGTYITGSGTYTANGGNVFVVFTNHTIETQWLVTDDLVFEWQTQNYSLGCVAPDSVVNDPDGNLYWLGTDSCFHRLFDDRRLSEDIDETIRNMHPTLRYYVRARYIAKLNRIWWAYPAGGAAEQNDYVASLNLELLTWDPLMPMAVSAFGEFSQQITYTIDTIPFDTIDGIGWETIDSAENVAGWPFDICGDYSGYTLQVAGDYGADAGESFTSEVVLGTDFERGWSVYKRCEGFWVWFKRHPDSDFAATVSVKSDETEDYEEVADVDLSLGRGDIVRTWCPCDFRGRDFLIKIAAANNFAFYGMIFVFTEDGEV